MVESLLRERIIETLTNQGFCVNGHIVPTLTDKNSIKKIHEYSKNEQIKLQREFLKEGYKTIRKYLINGEDIEPEKIDLELRVVEKGTETYKIFRWWNLAWWSVPYQRAYGRQIRFLLWDKTHNAPFGLLGLQSPILKMSVRDDFLQIPKESLDVWVNRSMQAQRLGAIPPYNQLLGGKMVALSLTSNELRKVYKDKYRNSETLIEKRIIKPDLLFLTTTSAFGRSSIYNRLKYKDEPIAESLGFTKGSGTFHIPQELYIDILTFLSQKGINNKTSFGNGPSRKIKLLDKAFGMLDLGQFTYHNIQREFFLFPLTKDLKQVISKGYKPDYYDRKLIDLTQFWKERWCIPRSERFSDWKKFNGEELVNKIMKESVNGNT